EPQVPNFVDPKSNQKLRPGMTLAIEPMVNAGNAGVKILNDGWTVVTQDGSLSAHFEHTVLITEGEPEILTWPERMPSKLKAQYSTFCRTPCIGWSWRTGIGCWRI